jgi:hypothetical protein
MIITYLEIKSWTGISIGATHSYGCLVGKGATVALMRHLSARDAKTLNRKDKCNTYKAGDTTERWDSEEDVVDHAMANWRHLMGGDVLMLGDRCYLDPIPVLDGPPELVIAGNQLFEAAEVVGFWEGDSVEMKKLCKQWDELWAD